MNKDRIKEITGKKLTKELHDELLSFNGDSLIECTKAHGCSFNSGFTVRTNSWKLGEKDRLKYTFFNRETYGNWKISEVK